MNPFSIWGKNWHRNHWLGLLLLACTWSFACAPATNPPSSNITLAFINDAQGELSDCGCSGGAAGGLARRVGYLADLRRQQPNSTILVEAGSFLFPIWPQNDEERQIEAKRADLIADAYRRVGFDAVLFGLRDYALGVEPLRQVAKKIGGAVVCANVIDARTGKPVWAEKAVVKKNHLQVGLLGVMTRSKTLDQQPVSPPAELNVVDPVAPIKRLARELRRQCGLVVLLANLERDELARLLAEVPGIDFVIKSRDSKSMTNQVDRLNKVPVVSLFERGQFIGRLDFTLVKPGEPFIDLTEKQMLERKLGRYQEYITMWETKAGGADKVDSYFAGDKDLLARYHSYQENVARWTRELEQFHNRGNRFQYELVKLLPGVKEDAETDRAVRQFETQYGTAAQARTRQMQRLAPPAPAPDTAE